MNQAPSLPHGTPEMLDLVSDGYMALNREWRYTYLNPAALQVLGRPSGELLGRVIWDEYPDTLERFGPHYRRAMEGRVVVEFEEYYAPLDLWTHLRIVPTPQGIGVIFRDITAHKRAGLYQDRLLALNTLLNAAALPEDVAGAILNFAQSDRGHYGGLLALTSRDGQELRITQHVGYEQATMDRWHRFSTALDVPLAYVQRSGEALFLSMEEARRRFPDLEIRTNSASLVCLPLHAGGGRVLGVLAFSYDTPRRFDGLERAFFTTLATQCAQALHRAQLYQEARLGELRYRLLTEATSAFTWTAEANMWMTEPQPTWAAFTGQSDEETRGHGWLRAIHPDDLDSLREQMREGMASGGRFELRARVRRADGEYRQVVSDVVPVVLARGEPPGLMGVVRDLTEPLRREQREQEVKRVVERLSYPTDPAELLACVLKEAARVTGAGGAALAAQSMPGGPYELLAAWGLPAEAPPELTPAGYSPTLLEAIEAGDPVEVRAGDPTQAGEFLRPYGARATLLRLPTEDRAPVVLSLIFSGESGLPEDSGLPGDSGRHGEAQRLLSDLAAPFGAAVQRARLLRDLAEREEHSRSIIEALEEGVVLVGESGEARAVNARARALLGLRAGQGGHTLEDACWSLTRPGGETLDREQHPAVRALRGERVRGEVLGLAQPGGLTTWWSLNAAPLPAVRGQSGPQAVVTVQDVGAQVALRQQLERQAAHDDLTGLPNRRTFTASLLGALRLAAQEGELVAVMLVNLDGFQGVNDTLGHHVGDEVLKVLGERLRQVAGTRGLASRLSGDEFGLLLPTGTPDGALDVAQALRAELARPVAVLGYEVSVTASVGVTFSPTDGLTPRELLRCADLALSRAKSSGRNSVGVYDAALAQERARRHELGLHLRRAILDGALHLAYQPIVDLETGTLVSVEALSRWSSPELGVVSPGEFIPVAEDTGLILPLGEWVLEAAAAQSAEWLLRTGQAVRVSVNVSPLQFMRPDFRATVEGVLRRSGLPADLLQLEITESAVMRDVEHARAQCAALRDLGVRLSLDDFGTGHSSLATLHALPLDQLKVDRAFVWGMEGDPRRVALMRSVLTLAGALDLDVVAEGIETPEQRQALQGLGCRLGQGFLFSRPLAPEDVAGWRSRAG